MATENRYLAPRVKAGDLGKRQMENGQFRNPPTYTPWGGFTSKDKLHNMPNHMSLERGGPSAQRGKPI